jgi:hypothetical protein
LNTLNQHPLRPLDLEHPLNQHPIPRLRDTVSSSIDFYCEELLFFGPKLRMDNHPWRMSTTVFF